MVAVKNYYLEQTRRKTETNNSMTNVICYKKYDEKVKDLSGYIIPDSSIVAESQAESLCQIIKRWRIDE